MKEKDMIDNAIERLESIKEKKGIGVLREALSLETDDHLKRIKSRLEKNNHAGRLHDIISDSLAGSGSRPMRKNRSASDQMASRRPEEGHHGLPDIAGFPVDDF